MAIIGTPTTLRSILLFLYAWQQNVYSTRVSSTRIDRYPSMLVSHLNSLLDGGAATAARRLHTCMLQQGLDSRFYHAKRTGNQDSSPANDLDSTYSMASWDRGTLIKRLSTAVSYRLDRQQFKQQNRRRPSGFEIFSSPQGAPQATWPPIGHPEISTHQKSAKPKTGGSNPGRSSHANEIIHLHWISMFLDYSSFFRSLNPDQPVVWTLHDMNAFTGGCHFSAGCQKYQTGCGGCPQLDPTTTVKNGSRDLSSRYFQQKQDALENVNLHVAAPSRWLLESARTSPVFQNANSFSHIPYSIDTENFYPVDRESARQSLGITSDDFVICFGAMGVSNRRKGALELTQALSQLSDLTQVKGLVFGSGHLPPADSMPPIIEVGHVHDDQQRRMVYSAADLFVLPSLDDNLPLTGLEAMACGTPIVGFASGGIPDYVRSGQSGLLAETGNANQLAAQIRCLVESPQQARQMGLKARQLMIDEYGNDREALAYRQLYQRQWESVKQSRSAVA